MTLGGPGPGSHQQREVQSTNVTEMGNVAGTTGVEGVRTGESKAEMASREPPTGPKLGSLQNPWSVYLRKGCGYLKNGCGYLRNGCGYLRNGCGYLRNGCGYLRNGCGYLRNGCGYLRNGCGYLQVTSGAQGSVLVGFWGGRQLRFFLRGGVGGSQRAVSTPAPSPPPVESLPTHGRVIPSYLVFVVCRRLS